MSLKICSIDGCSNKYYARGWCSKHYARWRSHGDPNYVKFEIQTRPEDGLCTISGCSKEYYFSGVCSAHYVRRMRHGDTYSEIPLQRRYFDPEEAFAANVRKRGECTEWTGLKVSGYGRIKAGGRSIGSHRYAWERENGPIPNGMEIDHICHNPACVNTDHLRLATHDQNVRNLSGPDSDNKYSKVRNVGKVGDRWRVRVTKDGTVHYLGVYDTIEEAAKVAEQARKELFGNFAGKG